VSIFRLFVRLFLGKRRTGFTHMADALPRERWTLAAGLLFVVLGGLFPNLIVARWSAQADAVALRVDRATEESRRGAISPGVRALAVGEAAQTRSGDPGLAVR